MLGLCGAQRVGKSTLAQAFARQQDIPYLATSASAVLAKMGLDPKVDYPFQIRMIAQEMILGAFELQYQAAQKKSALFIADRTPIDLASYLLSDVQRSTCAGDPGVSKAVCDYVERCIRAAGHYFSTIVLIQPGIQPVEEEGKAPADPAHMEHLTQLQLGILSDERCEVRRFVMPRRVVDLEQRLRMLTHSVSSAFEAQKTLSQMRLLH